jgi:hypothetical protein
MQFNEENKEKINKIVKLFEEGLGFYRTSIWVLALEKFNEVLEINPNDGPAKEFIGRCYYLTQKEFSNEEPWDGVWNFKTK